MKENIFQTPAHTPTLTYTSDKYFNKAFTEIKAMLDGQIPLNFKRAVFLSEYAYCGEEIQYDTFKNQIASTVNKLKEFIRNKKIEKFKTSSNYAIFEYMTGSNYMNEHQPCKYDFDDFYGEKDWRSTFVTKLIRTKKGNCRSLPYYYKILANEIGANAYLAFAPNHIYVKHIGEDGQWVNVELTNGSFSSDEWLIKSTGITQQAINNKIYLTPITEEQCIACCLFDLTQGYILKYGEDDFALLCSNTILKCDSNNVQTLMMKHNILRKMCQELTKDTTAESELKTRYKEYQYTGLLIEQLGYKELSKEDYNSWVRSVETEKNRQKNINL